MKLQWLVIGILGVTPVILAQGPPPPPPPGGTQQSVSQAPEGPADEPGRAVARLGILNGDASIRRGDSSDWVAAAVNAPLMSGDQISVAAGGRAEIEFDAAHFLRIAGDTELRLSDIDNGHYQVQVAHGLVTWRVLRNTQVQAEISTPLVAVHPGAQSTVRVEVSADGTSHITARRGEAEVSTEKGSERVAENTTMDVRGSMNDPEFQVVAAAPHDEFDGWSDQRDNYLLRAQSQRYVTRDVQGVEDLDPYGRWVYDPAYGWVWAPTVANNWAPYQNGQWVWEDYYGWTWVDYAPWGWAPFHYGYWYNRVGIGWVWYPGPRIGHVWWRPAMVGFFGWGGGVGFGVGFGFGNIGWVALAPHEVFHPWYGRGGFGGGAVLNAGIVRNVNVVGTFRNASVVNGVTAVTATDFQRGNFRNTVAVDRGTLSQASLVRGAVPMTPSSQNLRFSSRTAAVTPGAGVGASSRFYGAAGTAAASRRTPFTQQQATVRSVVSGQGSAVQSRMQSQPQNSFGHAAGQGAGSSSPNWQRFQGTPANGSEAGRSPAPAAGFSRYNGSSAPVNNGSVGSAPRQVQVSPSIVQQRSESRPGGGSSYGGNYSAPAQRSAPAGGGNRGSAPRGNNGHR